MFLCGFLWSWPEPAHRQESLEYHDVPSSSRRTFLLFPVEVLIMWVTAQMSFQMQTELSEDNLEPRPTKNGFWLRAQSHRETDHSRTQLAGTYRKELVSKWSIIQLYKEIKKMLLSKKYRSICCTNRYTEQNANASSTWSFGQVSYSKPKSVFFSKRRNQEMRPKFLLRLFKRQLIPVSFRFPSLLLLDLPDKEVDLAKPLYWTPNRG